MGMIKHTQPASYDDGLTKQAFKDSCDINKLLSKAQRAETLSHLQQFEPVYGDFTDIGDLLDAESRLARARSIFERLPSELRREFRNDVGEFFKYVNDPKHAGKLGELLPALAKPGVQRIVPVRTAPTAPKATPDPTPPVSAPKDAQSEA